jgi:hypothetical protein
MLHILAGNADDDIGLVLEAAKSGEAVSWIVPKKAHSNDRALFHLPHPSDSFFAPKRAEQRTTMHSIISQQGARGRVSDCSPE